jgi:DNA repair ATPase RecN
MEQTPTQFSTLDYSRYITGTLADRIAKMLVQIEEAKHGLETPRVETAEHLEARLYQILQQQLEQARQNIESPLSPAAEDIDNLFAQLGINLITLREANLNIKAADKPAETTPPPSSPSTPVWNPPAETDKGIGGGRLPNN